jgi:hypothetical protein
VPKIKKELKRNLKKNIKKNLGKCCGENISRIEKPAFKKWVTSSLVVLMEPRPDQIGLQN